MDHHHDDTEMLIALVSSLLDRAVDHEAILEALVLADGDVQCAANILDENRNGEKQKRRKKSTLDGWLDKSKMPPAERRNFTQTSEGSSSSVIKPNSKGPPRSKPPLDLMTILQPPPSPDKGKRKLKSLPPLTLTTASMVAAHTPCTLHLSVLPPELACRLFYTMIEAAKKWQRTKWWLFDRVVESPHRTSFYARSEDDDRGDARDVAEWQEAARFWYNGRMTDPPEKFPPEMEQACRIVEKVVNEELRKRKRYPLEYGGNQQVDSGVTDPVWRANVAASNCYEGAKESVGFHSDQLTYLGPYPTIASLSLGTERVFRLREVIPTDEIESRKARTFNIPLPHNSLTIMHASCQEKFKHAIPPQSAIDIFRPTVAKTTLNQVDSAINPADPRTSDLPTFSPSNCRINITFRFYRPDFRPQSIPKCDCGVQTILRPDMKNRTDGKTDKYWWTCYAGAQNEGKGCKFWRDMDMKKEGRGPCVGDLNASAPPNSEEESPPQ